MKNYMNTNDLMALVNKAVVPDGSGSCLYGGEQTETLPGGGFHGGEQTETLPGGGFHGGEQTETLPGGGFHGGRTEVPISTSWNSRY